MTLADHIRWMEIYIEEMHELVNLDQSDRYWAGCLKAMQRALVNAREIDN